MRWIIAGSIAVIGAIALYLASAAISVDRLVEAARAGNAAEVVKRTDLDRLRRSLVDQIIAAYLERIGKKDRPLERLVAQTYGATIADAMLQKMLGADNLTKLLQTGTIGGAGVSTSLVPNVLSINVSEVGALIGRVSWVKSVEFFIRTSEATERDASSGVSFHFEGTEWKLSGINLPKNVTRQLAASLPTK